MLEFLPGEEAQVDNGQGAPTRTASGKYQRPILFAMTLKYSEKSFRKVVWKTSQAVWTQLNEEAFRAFGGCCWYMVLDNLKEGVLQPDWHEPGLNPVFAAHSWAEETPSARTVPGGTAALAAPAPRRLWCFTQGVRTVDDAGLVQIDGAYYAVGEAALASVVTVRVYAHAIEIVDRTGAVLRRHAKARRKGAFVMAESDLLFNPSRHTARVLARAAQIGPPTAALAQVPFARLCRLGQRALYGLASLPRILPMWQ